MYLLFNTFLTGVVVVARSQPQAAQGFALSSTQQLESSKSTGQAWNKAFQLYHSSLWKITPLTLFEREINLFFIFVSGFFFVKFISLVLWKWHLEVITLQQGITVSLYIMGKKNPSLDLLWAYEFFTRVHLLFPHCNVHLVQDTCALTE